MSDEQTKLKLGVVLSGGGAKGAYEAGFLKSLAEFNIQPDAIAGTSIGALNGAVYAAQVNTEEVAGHLEKIWKDLARSKALQVDKTKAFLNIIEVVSYFSPLAPVTRVARVIKTISMAKSQEGACTTKPVENILDKYAPVDKLLKGLPFYVGVTESSGNLIDTLRLVGLSNSGLTSFVDVRSLDKDDMHKIILASAALPLAFDSVTVDGKNYRDGCLGSQDNEWGNTLAKPLITEEKCTHLIVCHLSEGSFFNRHDPIFEDVAIIEIRPEPGTFNSIFEPLKFSVDKIDAWMEQGYKDSNRILKDAFDALAGKYTRISSERKAEDAVQSLKSKRFAIPDCE